MSWRLLGLGDDGIIRETLRLKELVELLFVEFAFQRESTDSFVGDFPLLEGLGVLLLKLAVALLELVVFGVQFLDLF